MKKLILILLTTSLLFSCEDDSVLKDSVFVNDPQNPGLPKYSELGYNTFGAYYDRQSFTSRSGIPVKVSVTDGPTSFMLIGGTGGYSMSLTIQMTDFLPETYSDLIELDDTLLDLEDNAYTVLIRKGDTEYEAEILNGTFHFKHAQNLVVDKSPFGVILSGTFEFQALIDGEPITVSDGRFDVSVYEDNFYTF